MASRRKIHRDPYYRCELHCNHDLGSGMSVSELLGTAESQPARSTTDPERRSYRLSAARRVPVLGATAIGS